MKLHRPIATNLCVFAMFAFLSSVCDADELRLDAEALWKRTVSQNLRLDRDGMGIELEEGELFEDDGPAAGYSFKPNVEKLTPGTRIKKELIIPNPSARKAKLLIAPGGTLKAVINGQEQPLGDGERQGSYWQAYEVPPDFLRRGKNEFVLFGEGRIWIARDDEYAAGSRERTRHPNRSAKSGDDGKTWSYDRLGPDGKLDGEYYVRLFLERYRPRGSLVLPVIDVGNLAGQTIAPPVESVGPMRIRLTAEAGPGGKIAVRARSGPSPIPNAEKSWSPWQELGAIGGTLKGPRGRYLQLRIDLATADPLRTPKIKQLAIESDPRRPDDWTKSVRVVECHNEQIVRSSIPFEYEPFNHPRLKLLRERHKLDERVAGAQSEMQVLSRLAAWAAKGWEHPGHIGSIYPAWDALEILKPHTDGTPVGGFCQQYNVVFLQACESLGFVGRAVSIGPGSQKAKLRCGGHEVVEIWSNEHKKWIYVDGNMAWYAVDSSTKVPLSLLELRARQLQVLSRKDAKPVEIVRVADSGREWTNLNGWPPFVALRLIPRSNFLKEQSPLPLNQGMRGWFWTGHYVWTDAESRAALLYGNRVSRCSNWNWTLNQARYVLEATDRPGQLRVHVDTETPGFETFLAKIDGADQVPVSSGFVWQLHEGENRLQVKVRNHVGREGPASWIVLHFAGS